MNHLPITIGPHHPHPEIDYICSQTFVIPKDASFETYPRCHGLDPAILMQTMDFSPLEEWQADSLIQEWLLFVFLADLFGRVGVEFQLRDFVEEGGARYEGEPVRKIVTTRRLGDYLRRWNEYETAQGRLRSTAELQEAGSRRAGVLKLVQRAQVAVATLLQSQTKYVSFGPFMFSIVCVFEAIQNATYFIYGSTLSEEDVYSELFWLRVPDARWPLRRMRENGSCPNQIRRLQSLCLNTGVYFASSLRLPDGAMSFVHSDCEELRCKVNYIDRTTYEPKHKCNSGGCPLIGPDKEKVRHLLEKGCIPILGFANRTGDINKEVVFEVLSSEEMPYTAISHVWSDGRGNLKANTLPTCQVNYLRTIIQEISPSNNQHYFWMDTFCVPVEQSLRREAIGLMRKTYQDAAQVLILDSSLELAPSEAEPEEILMRTQIAGWMRRLWTLQEGALARKLLVRFRDASIDLHLLAKSVQDSRERQLQSPLAQDALNCVYSFQAFQGRRRTGLLELIRALQ